MAPLHPFLRNSLFTTKIPMCNITLLYYTGFAYCMLQVRATHAGARSITHAGTWRIIGRC